MEDEDIGAQWRAPVMREQPGRSRQNTNILTTEIKLPTRRYLDEFVSLKCAPDLLALELFPNSKEITESMAAYHAARKYLWGRGFAPDDPTVKLVVVGDGARPRTTATYVFRTRWHGYAVDPALTDRYVGKIARLRSIPTRIEEFRFDAGVDPLLVVAVHSHASLDAAVRNLTGRHRAVIAIPCCVSQHLTLPCGRKIEPDISCEDWGIWSPRRMVKVWKDV